MKKTRYGHTILSSIREYENPYMRINKLPTIRPNGKEKPYWVLHRGSDCSVIIPLLTDDTTILVGQYRVGADKYSWEFPLGNVLKVTPLAAAKQELLEETGYTAEHWVKLGGYYLAPGWCSQKVHVFLARKLHVANGSPEEFEFLKTKKVKIKTVKKMIETGKIIDGLTIAAYHLLESSKKITL
jgi:ADP-ribose pyrophosphatase